MQYLGGGAEKLSAKLLTKKKMLMFCQNLENRLELFNTTKKIYFPNIFLYLSSS